MRLSFSSFTILAVLLAGLDLQFRLVGAQVERRNDTVRRSSLFIDVPGIPGLPDANSTKLAARDAGLDLDNIQHDILTGMIKTVELFFFFGISDAATFKSQLTSNILPLITSVSQVLTVETQPITAVNLAFSASGLSTLGVDPTTLNNDVYNTGQWADVGPLGDPGTNWVPAFAGTTIHGLFILQSDTVDNINDQLSNIQDSLGNSITELHRVNGAVRPGDQAGHEHFGFLDGISQPAVNGFNTNPLPGQLPVDAGRFLLGETNDSLARPDWAKDSSFLAFRQLQQKVPEFQSYLLDNALTENGLTQEQGAELLGARMVGRWKSGAPVDLTPTTDDPTLAQDPQRNNDFDFTHLDVPGFDINTDESFCPFAAHIRKTNPRADFGNDQDPKIQDPVNHILRSGIPYGPEVTTEESTSGVSDPSNERGLAFVCYQSNYHDGFRFLQSAWANTPQFFFGHTPEPGFDPIIGANLSNPRNATGFDPSDYSHVYTLEQDFVVSRGGEYFLTPSISGLSFIASQ